MDGERFRDYNIGKESTVRVVARTRGGGGSVKRARRLIFDASVKDDDIPLIKEAFAFKFESPSVWFKALTPSEQQNYNKWLSTQRNMPRIIEGTINFFTPIRQIEDPESQEL